jgi:hypothetical protein
MRDAERLKRQIDKLAPSYAIAIKGKAFPPVLDGENAPAAPNVTLIAASSWAMANFIVERFSEENCENLGMWREGSRRRL